MPYTEPRLQIFQDFEPALAAGAAPLFATIVGPNYYLHRFSVEDEQARMGDYDATVASADYLWPDHVPGAVIDQATARLFVQNAVLRYYQSFASAEVPTDDANKIFSSVIFKSNEYADRTASAFGDRDVQIGDIAILRWIDPGSSLAQVFETVVAGFEADVVPGTTDPEPFRASGTGDTTAGSTELSDPPDKFGTSYDVSAYDALAQGFPLDTYTVRVDQVGIAGTGGLGGTILTFTSVGGDTSTIELDDSLLIATTYYIPMGVRGAVLELTPGAGSVFVGEQWSVAISQSYTEADVADDAEFDVTGPYTGEKNTQYQISIVQGGLVGTDDLLVNYTTNNGADIDGQITVPASDFSGSPVDYALGTLGMVVTFVPAIQWNAGDLVLVDVEAEQEGAIHTLLFKDPIPVVTGIEMDMDLHVVKDVEFPESRYTLTADTITVEGNAFVIDDILGTVEPFAIIRGPLFADYRELNIENCNRVLSISSLTSIDDELGPAVELNPLGLAVDLARRNSGSVDVLYVALCEDSVTGYEEALEVLTENDFAYGLVPLSDDSVVKGMFRDHVLERSNENNNQWRKAWFGNTTSDIKAIETEAPSGGDLMATVEEFGTGLYRRVESLGALFATTGVEAGDTLRINYSLDTEGNDTYDEYIIDRVESEDSLILVSSLPGPITVAVKIEVHRDLNKNEFAEELSLYPATYDTRRINSVYIDGHEDELGNPRPLYYAAAALAGERSGVAPHAPLSQVELEGIYIDQQKKFSRDQLNVIAGGGNWIVVKDFTGRIFTRHQLTTDMSDLNRQEDSITSNLDHISRDFLANTKDLFGQGNVSPAMVELIRQRVNSLIDKISNRPYPAKIGPQMLDAEILKLEIDPLLRDTINVEIDPDLPVPLNNLIIRFKVSN
jgi:hypothetical protein